MLIVCKVLYKVKKVKKNKTKIMPVCLNQKRNDPLTPRVHKLVRTKYLNADTK